MEKVQNNKETLYNLFDLSCNSLSSEPAVLFHDGQKKIKLNYKQLYDQIQIISAVLLSVSASGEVIGCLCIPNIILPALILGTLKVSSAFTFIDLQSPIKFLENLQKYVTVRIILAEKRSLEMVKTKLSHSWSTDKEVIISNTSLVVLRLNNDHETECNRGNPRCIKNRTDIAYVIQTSGTTGEPKVVQVVHQCIIPNILHLRSLYGVTSKDIIFLAAPLTFDPSIVEIFLALTSGSTLLTVSNSIKSVPEKLAQVIIDNGVTILQATPSLIQRFGKNLLQNVLLKSDSALRILSLGGERCPSVNTLLKWKGKGNQTQFFNLYGITEVSCWATCEKVKNLFEQNQDSEVPLGDPLLDTEIELRNKNGEVIQEGYGQLFIGGTKRWCVIGNEEFNAKSQRIMRPTGDWVHKNKYGEIFYEGRQDNLIKHYGKKISLCSVNRILENITYITSHSLHFDQKDAKLYILAVLCAGCDKREDEVRALVLQYLSHLNQPVPPADVIFVPFIPITSHGKTDTRKILNYAKKISKRKINEQSSISEEAAMEFVTSLWKEYTRKNAVNEADNFILNGGDSITTVQFALEVEWRFQVLCPRLVDLLLNTTFESVCAYLKEHLINTENNECKSKREKHDNSLMLDNTGKKRTERKKTETAVSKGISSEKVMELQSTKNEISNIYIEENKQKSKQCIPQVFSGTKKLVSLANCLLCYKESNRRGINVKCHCHRCPWFHKMKEIDCFEIDKVTIKEVFKYNLKKCVDASACVCHFIGGHSVIFIGSHSGCFAAVDAENGAVIWEVTLQDRIESSACLSACGHFVLVGCYDHYLYCFSAQNGEIKWKMKTDAEIKSSPLVLSSNTAYFGSHDHHLYAVDIKTGHLKWKTKISNGSIFSSPTASNNLSCIYAASLDGTIVSLHTDSGSILWKYKYGKPLFSSPLTVKSGVCIGSVDGFVLYFNTEGQLEAKFHTNGPVFSSPSSFILSNEGEETKECIVFGSHDSKVYCYSLCGALLWSFLCSSPVYSTPFPFVINNDICKDNLKRQLYIAVACTAGTIYILDAENGSLISSYESSGEIFSSPVIMNSHLFVGCRDNYVYCFKLSEDGS